MIARAGNPLARLIPVGSISPPRPLGFRGGTVRVEADLTRDFEAEINAMFLLAGDLPPDGIEAMAWIWIRLPPLPKTR